MKLTETLVVNGVRYELAAVPHEFREDPLPLFVWHVADVEVRKSAFRVSAEETEVVQYFLRAQGPAARHLCQLEVKIGEANMPFAHDAAEYRSGILTFELITHAAIIFSRRNYTIRDAGRLRRAEVQRLRGIKWSREVSE